MPRLVPPPPPSLLYSGGAHSFDHDAIALSFFVVTVAATLAFVSSMCSACGRKPKPKPPDQSAGGGHGDEASADAEEEEAVVTLAPELATHGPIEAVTLPSSTSKRRLSVSLSKNLKKTIPDKLRLSLRVDRNDHHIPHIKMETSEDPLWKKGIILGEKCRIPGERDGDDDPADDIAAGSFRRSSYSRPVSRSNSFAMHQQQQQPNDDACDGPAASSLLHS